MGFGWLFVGYFFVQVISLYSPLSFAMLAGYPMMILGLWLLAPYHKHFKTAFFSSFLAIPFAIWFSLYAFSQLGVGTGAIFKGPLFDIAEWGYFAFNFLFTVIILTAILSLCRELALMSLQGTAMRNLLVFGAMCVLDLISRMPFLSGARIGGYLVLTVLFLKLIIIFLNLHLIFSCYRRIAPEGEELSAPRTRGAGKGKEE